MLLQIHLKQRNTWDLFVFVIDTSARPSRREAMCETILFPTSSSSSPTVWRCMPTQSRDFTKHCWMTSRRSEPFSSRFGTLLSMKHSVRLAQECTKVDFCSSVVCSNLWCRWRPGAQESTGTCWYLDTVRRRSPSRYTWKNAIKRHMRKLKIAVQKWNQSETSDPQMLCFSSPSFYSRWPRMKFWTCWKASWCPACLHLWLGVIPLLPSWSCLLASAV